MGPGRLLPILLCAALGACNSLLSEKPMFSPADRSSVLPRDGLWLGEDAECAVDSSTPTTQWPECAMWIIVGGSGTDLEFNDGKRQSQHLSALFTKGTPLIIEAQWVDNAKHPPTITYVYIALDPHSAGPDGRFTRASAWPVECGVQEGGSSEIRPFPGITPECRPMSKEAIHAAATASRQSKELMSWRWLRAENH